MPDGLVLYLSEAVGWDLQVPGFSGQTSWMEKTGYYIH